MILCMIKSCSIFNFFHPVVFRPFFILSGNRPLVDEFLTYVSCSLQACYSLGNTYTLLNNYEEACENHLKHLEIAQELGDR